MGLFSVLQFWGLFFNFGRFWRFGGCGSTVSYKITWWVGLVLQTENICCVNYELFCWVVEIRSNWQSQLLQPHKHKGCTSSILLSRSQPAQLAGFKLSLAPVWSLSFSSLGPAWVRDAALRRAKNGQDFCLQSRVPRISGPHRHIIRGGR